MEQILSTVKLAVLRALDLLNSNVKNKGGNKTADGEETFLPPARSRRRFWRLENIFTLVCITLDDVTFTDQGILVGHQSFHAHLDHHRRRKIKDLSSCSKVLRVHGHGCAMC